MTRKRLDSKAIESLTAILDESEESEETDDQKDLESAKQKINKQIESLMGRDLTRLFNTNSWRAKYMKSVYKNLVNDMGGQDMMSYSEIETARRCAALAVIGAEFEQALLVYDDEKFDLESYLLLARTQAQLFKILGYKRRAKTVKGPSSLSELIKATGKTKRRESSGKSGDDKDVEDAVEVGLK